MNRTTGNLRGPPAIHTADGIDKTGQFFKQLSKSDWFRRTFAARNFLKRSVKGHGLPPKVEIIAAWLHPKAYVMGFPYGYYSNIDMVSFMCACAEFVVFLSRTLLSFRGVFFGQCFVSSA